MMKPRPAAARSPRPEFSAQGLAQAAKSLLQFAEGGANAVSLFVMKSSEYPASKQRGHGNALRRCEG